jgi:hypothetical protein
MHRQVGTPAPRAQAEAGGSASPRYPAHLSATGTMSANTWNMVAAVWSKDIYGNGKLCAPVCFFFPTNLARYLQTWRGG